MARYDRIPTSIMVTPLDLSEDEQAALTYLRAHAQTNRDLGQEADMPMEVKVSPTWGVVETDRGLFALCTEGVGPNHPITDDSRCEFEVFIDRYERDAEGGPEFISMFAACTFKLGPEELRERATGEPVPLHEFVRRFGGRLEANYDSWRRLLETAVA